MKNFFVTQLQKALNHYLSLDPESAHKLQGLNHKVVTIELSGINISFQLYFIENQISIKHENFLQANTIIKGTPLRLLQMSLSKNRKQFFADDVAIEGDLELGQQVIDLFDQLEIDWEEYLSQWVGDVPAHQIGRLARGIKQWTEKTRQIFCENMNEYIHEEIEFFPPKEALNDFFEDIDILRMDADRIEARMQILEKSMKSKRGLS